MIDAAKYPRLASALESGSVVVDGDNDYRRLDGSPWGINPAKDGTVRPIKLAAVGTEEQAERLLTEKGL